MARRQQGARKDSTKNNDTIKVVAGERDTEITKKPKTELLNIIKVILRMEMILLK